MIRKWVIKKLVGNTPIIMNVTLTVVGEIQASKPNGIFEKCNIKSFENQMRRRGVKG
ncbi:hypothetical protein QNH20_19125 [Neobacillus sp. WH10]|uniref:hypothetical protein n=1 Tax=Neobacillus sp. WH10 TaxID=3047873 RepID=UPI0024C12226|nr:hypothetical protein [Neobacillus sp. WH10]WHY76219.1 hypothetical protein QNH20_19125 [Neobacillus sp. WH10]